MKRNRKRPSIIKLSSSEEDDEEQAKLMSAIDHNFAITSSTDSQNSSEMHNRSGNSSSDNDLKSVRKEVLNIEGEFPKPYSLDVTPEMQNFIAKKLSTVLDKTIEDIPESQKKVIDKDTDDLGIYLFTASSVQISSKDTDVNKDNERHKKRKKPKLQIKRHFDGSESDEEESKLRAVAVSAEWVKTDKSY